MPFAATIDRNVLLPALQHAAQIADRGSTQEILGSVLLRNLGGGSLLVAGTDLRSAVQHTLAADIATGEAACVPARELVKITAALPNGPVTLAADGPGDYMRVASGKRLEYKLVGTAARDYPMLPDAKGVRLVDVPAKALCGMLRRTFPFASRDETRLHLRGVLIDTVQGSTCATATNAHCLAHYQAGAVGLLEGTIFVDLAGVQMLLAALDGVDAPVKIGVHQGHLFVQHERMLLSSTLRTEAFPPYQQVIPTSSEWTVRLERAALADALERVQIVAVGKTLSNKVTFQLRAGELLLTAEDAELGTAREALEVVYDGPEHRWGMNAAYILQHLATVETPIVQVSGGDELDPVRFDAVETPNAHLAVIMPMRI